MLNNITYYVNHTELFSIVASSADKYAIVTMTGHEYGYACAFVSVFARTDIAGIHDELVSDVELTKDQITHFLSLDCPDAFIAYALTLCPCPPETSDTVAIGDTAEVDGGNLSYLDQLSSVIVPAKFDIDKAISEFNSSYSKGSRSYPKGGDSFLRFESIPPVNGMELPSNLE